MTRCTNTHLIFGADDELRIHCSDLSKSAVIQTGDFTDSLSISFDLSHLEKLEGMVRMLQEMKQRKEAALLERQLAVVVGEFEEAELVF